MYRFDHAIISVNNLQQAVNDYRALGFNVTPGGRHANNATHNALIIFKDGSYFELMAKTGEPPVPDLPDYSKYLDTEGFIGYALASETLEQDVHNMRSRGVNISEPEDGGRTRPDGTEVRWKLAFINGGLSPFFIEDITPRNVRIPDNPALAEHPNGATGVFDISIIVDDLDETTALYRNIFGSDPSINEAGTHFSLKDATVTLYSATVDAVPSRPTPHEIALTTSKDAVSLEDARTHLASIQLVHVTAPHQAQEH